MKTITIGRGEGCDIFIDDYRISRRHALLKIFTFGKMEIVDMGKNGTWVNGVKLRPGVPFPVKRKDVVKFADATLLDWKKVKDPLKYYRIGGIITCLVILAIFAISLIANNVSGPSSEYEISTNDSYANPQQHDGGKLVPDSATITPKPGKERNDSSANKNTVKDKTVNVSDMKSVFDKQKENEKEKDNTKKKESNGSKNGKAAKDKQQNNNEDGKSPLDVF